MVDTEHAHQTSRLILVTLVIQVLLLIGVTWRIFQLEAILTGQGRTSPQTQQEEVASPELFTEEDPWIGPRDAKVTIVVFSDFQCPACRSLHRVLSEVQEVYPDDLAIVYRDFPFPTHPEAFAAAMAGYCAHVQGEFWKMADLLFENQRGLTIDIYDRLAERVGLDPLMFDECMDSSRALDEVSADYQAGLDLGVNGTPYFFVNGARSAGAVSLESLSIMVERALTAAAPAH